MEQWFLDAFKTLGPAALPRAIGRATSTTAGDVATSTTYSLQQGTEIKRGRIVTFQLSVAANVVFTTAAGDLRVKGLNFTSHNRTHVVTVRCGEDFDWPTNGTITAQQLVGEVPSSSAYVKIFGQASGWAGDYVSATNVPTGTDVKFDISGTYITS